MKVRQRTERQLSIVETVPPPPTAKWRHCHILDLDDFSEEEISLVFEITDAMLEVLSREVRRVPTLRGKTIVIMFYEPSTRTRGSFELAAKALGADIINFSVSGSSLEKGESLVDTLRTLQALGADAVVMRHQQSGAPYLAAQHVNTNVINAGDGWHAHPTQALLDLYTMQHHLKHLKGAKVVIIGDIMHSRVARSNIWGLSTMGAEVTLCAPPTLLPSTMDKAYYGKEKLVNPYFPPVIVQPSIEHALDGADVVMTLRLQLERQQSGLLPSIREYIQLYQLTAERLKFAKSGALVLHPGPMNEGIEITPEVAHGVQSVIEEQVVNGVAVRMALLYLVTGGKRL